ncbi:MAG: hypothetical protein LBJ18_04080, partial [Rickettsiales bacterium]|nr:hypothetical protein [Rickettsiales bacterium]
EVFGYGLVNLERATKPGSKIYYYNGSDIVSGSGDAYWRAASTTAFSPSAAIGIRSGSISASYYDVLESAEGELYMPRVFENEFALNAGGRRGLYLGDVLGEFETQKAEGIGQKAGGVSFDMKFSESNRTGDNLNGLQNMSFGFATGDYSVGAKFQRHLSDFDDKVALVRGDRDNPILSLASNAISSSAALKSGNWSFGGRAFSGAITDETLLENDPSLTAQYMPANLGQASGAESRVGWSNEKLSFGVNIGTMKETATVLGAYTDGLLALGGGDTIYLDNVVGFAATPDVRFMARATFAKTRANPGGEFVLGLSELESDAFSAGAEIGNFSFTAAMPLAVSKGVMQYAGADYSVMENEDGNYDLVADTYAGNLNLAPEKRETRFSAMYRFGIDENTNAAVGVIYRLHPNHTDDFGSEGILMMKLKHSW